MSRVIGTLILFGFGFALFGAFRATDTVQRGYPGNGIEQVVSKKSQAKQIEANKVPAAFPPASQDGQLAATAYKNVKVLGHLSTGEFTRVMTAVSTWVAPSVGCAYCHLAKPDAEGNLVVDADHLDSDEVPAKVIARRMFQMTMHVNADWKKHVADTGVTCYTCHRGQPVPPRIWYQQPDNAYANSFAGNRAGQNEPSAVTAWTSLPVDPFTPYLAEDANIRVISDTALPDGNRSSIKQTEWTYGLMMHMSDSLGVNCTYCHNTRSMADWSSSSPARTTAWHGIRMVRDINNNFVVPLHDTYLPDRLGPNGDSPKVNCATCHQGAYKPLLGASMLKDYLALAMPHDQPAPGGQPNGNAPQGTTTTTPSGTVVPGGTVSPGTTPPTGSPLPTGAPGLGGAASPGSTATPPGKPAAPAAGPGPQSPPPGGTKPPKK